MYKLFDLHQLHFYRRDNTNYVVVFFQSDSADAASELDFSTMSDVDTIMSLVNTRFEKKERQLKSEMRDEFEKRLERDHRHHEEVIATLKRDLSQLTKVSHECDSLKERQTSLQQEINDQHEKILLLREENAQLKSENARLQQLQNELEVVKAENDSLKREQGVLEVKNLKLRSTISEKEQEISSLKFLIDTQYKRIKLDLTNTRDKFYNEQESLQKDMRQQHLMLTEISEAVKTLKGRTVKEDRQRDIAGGKPLRSTVVKIKPFVGGKTSTSSSFNKLTLNETPVSVKKKN